MPSSSCPDAPLPISYEPTPPLSPEGPHPFESVCRIWTRRKNLVLLRPKNNSTGFLIGDDLVLTAAHNVHSVAGSRLLEGKMWFGASAGETVWGPVEFGPEDVWVAPEYAFRTGFLWRYKVYHRDFAIIRLRSRAPFSSSLVLPKSDMALTRCERVTIAGHPTEDLGDAGTTQMQVAHGNLTQGVGRDLFDYDIATQGGNSGGPVWVKRGDDAVVAGVHVNTGTARRIDREVLDAIEAQRR